MKGKIIVLISMVILLSGCDAVYKLEYTDNSFKETFIVNNLRGYEEQVRSVYSFALPTDFNNESDLIKEEGVSLGYTYYEQSLNDDGNLSLKYYYNFDKDKYSNSYIGRSFFPKLNFQNETLYSGNILDVYTMYPSLDNITIEFYTDKEVVNNNADKIDGDRYYWYLNKENYQSKKIELVLSLKDNSAFEVVKQNVQDEILDNESFNWNVVFIIGGIVLVGLGIFIFVKVKNSNKK